MKVHLIDGTYELFRHHYALPAAADARGAPIAATRGVTGAVLRLLEAGATHVGVATDHVIESFRNDLFPGYKTGAGVDPALAAQFEPLEAALAALGVAVWPMVAYEADDALASAAVRAAADRRVERVFIGTPDKDLAQCVAGDRIVQWDRVKDEVRDEAGVRARFGVAPASIPDLLALVGDAADGLPGLPGWGSKTAAGVLARYPHLEDIPADPAQWTVAVRGAARLAETLRARWSDALLYRTLATLKTDLPVFAAVDDLRWPGPKPEFEALGRTLRADGLWTRAVAAAARL